MTRINFQIGLLYALNNFSSILDFHIEFSLNSYFHISADHSYLDLKLNLYK